MSDGIFNFRRIDPGLATAGQPTEAQLRALVDDGCRYVVNLHTNDPRWALPGEAELLAELGVEYHNVPVVFAAPEPADYARFEQLMQARGGRGTLVHCVANYRVSAFMAIYGERHLGWDRARADAFVADVWQPDAVWTDFIARMRGTGHP
jgi:protein tyrosine phosphatase (PTP) superfamily phosphohydrolase (DUF442 family)